MERGIPPLTLRFSGGVLTLSQANGGVHADEGKPVPDKRAGTKTRSSAEITAGPIDPDVNASARLVNESAPSLRQLKARVLAREAVRASSTVARRGIFGGDPVATAEEALQAQGIYDVNDDYVAGQLLLLRRLSQLGLGRYPDGPMRRRAGTQVLVTDVGARHGVGMTQIIAGTLGLVPDLEVWADWPTQSPEQRRPQITQRTTERLGENPSVDDVLTDIRDDYLKGVSSIGRHVDHYRSEHPPNTKTIVNMSWGYYPSLMVKSAATRILKAPEGSELHAEATRVLGHPPTLTDAGNGELRVDPNELEKIARELVVPGFKEKLDDPEFQQRLAAEKAKVSEKVAAAREEGILIFKSSGNDQAWMAAVGAPELAGSVTNDIPGIITVGAVNTAGPGDEDDTIAYLSALPSVEVAARGIDVPVYVGEDGIYDNVNGTSISTAIMSGVAAALARNNDKLSVADIEAILLDERVVSYVDGTPVIGGPDDVFAALVLGALNPEDRARVTRAQIDEVAKQLDAAPDAQVDLRTLLNLDRPQSRRRGRLVEDAAS